MPNSLLSSGSRGMTTSEKQLETIGNNVSNTNSISFKKKKIEVTDAFSQTLRSASSSSGGPGGSGSNVTPIQVGTGCQMGSVVTDFSKGHKEETGRGTDLYLGGKGFLRVKDSISGASYATRSGNLRIDDRGYVTTPDGLRLQAYLKALGAMPTYEAVIENGELRYNQVAAADLNAEGATGDLLMDYDLNIANRRLVNRTNGDRTDAQVEANAPTIKSYSIAQDGDVTFTMTDDSVVTVGTILLMKFRDEQALTNDGRGLYSNFDPAGPEAFNLENSRPGSNGLAKIESGALELSNVDLTYEFTKMIESQRSFQANARLIKVADEVLEEIVNLKR